MGSILCTTYGARPAQVPRRHRRGTKRGEPGHADHRATVPVRTRVERGSDWRSPGRVTSRAFCPASTRVKAGRYRTVRAQEDRAAVMNREGLPVPAQSMGRTRRAPEPRAYPARQKFRRRRHPPVSHRQAGLALHRTSRRAPTLVDPPLFGRLVPAPRQGTARVPPRRPRTLAGDDESGRPHPADALGLGSW